MCSVSQETRSSVYDDFDKILSEFMAMSAEMPKVANKLMEVLIKRRKLLGLIFNKQSRICNSLGGFPNWIAVALSPGPENSNQGGQGIITTKII